MTCRCLIALDCGTRGKPHLHMVLRGSEDTTAEDAKGGDSAVGCWVPRLMFLHPRCQSYIVSRGETCVGRSSACSIVLEGERVSRVHCRLVHRGGRVFVVDATSRNGTFVNGKPAENVELGAGDVLRIGDWLGLVASADACSDLPPRVVSGMFAGAALQQLLQRAARVASTPLPLIVSGETGSGKELVARFVHEQSGRKGAFLALNCASLTDTLAEAQLFGHVRGAYTGAGRDRIGAFRRAHQGTLFLDEVGELTPAVQAKLLRVLEDFRVTPLGTSDSHAVDVRIIVAGHGSLQAKVDAGQFRGDLYARLNGLELLVPPLRQRKEEILALFLATFEKAARRPAPALSAEFAESLLLHRWPYNARQVVQIARRLAALHGDKPTLTTAELPRELSRSAVGSGSATQPSSRPKGTFGEVSASRHLTQVSELYEALERHDGNLTRAARAMGISRGRAYRLMALWKARLNAPATDGG